MEMTFNYNNPKALRVEKDGDGNLWFVANDVCEMLDLSNPTEAMRSLDDDEHYLTSVVLRSDNGVEQKREVNMINESGMYHLIFLSRKEEAKKFRRWVTGEVLPQIRKTGRYAGGFGGQCAIMDPEELRRRNEVRVFKAKLSAGDMLKMANGTGMSYYTVQSTLNHKYAPTMERNLRFELLKQWKEKQDAEIVKALEAKLNNNG